jgi:hypothetical protein
MGVVLMSKRELNRIDVLARLDGRRLTPPAMPPSDISTLHKQRHLNLVATHICLRWCAVAAEAERGIRALRVSLHPFALA